MEGIYSDRRRDRTVVRGSSSQPKRIGFERTPERFLTLEPKRRPAQAQQNATKL